MTNETPLPGPLPAKPRKAAKKAKRAVPVKAQADCPHPKAKRINLGYRIKCGVCGHIL